jgi:hypothetical protein
MSATIDLKQNISYSVECQWKTAGVPKDLTGYTLASKIKDKDFNLVHEFTYLTDLTWVDQSLGLFKMEVLNVSTWTPTLLRQDVIITKISNSLISGTKTFNVKNTYGIT